MPDPDQSAGRSTCWRSTRRSRASRIPTRSWPRIVELRFFGGLTLEETGRALGLTSRQVDYSWSLARAWLHRELRRAQDAGS